VKGSDEKQSSPALPRVSAEMTTLHILQFCSSLNGDSYCARRRGLSGSIVCYNRPLKSRAVICVALVLLSPSLLLAACTDIPRTNIPVGAACFGASSYPTLTNPHDPINYGADNTGVNDSTTAINSAFSAGGDVQFGTAGTYLVTLSSGHGIIPPPKRILECAPGVAVTLIERSDNCGTDCGIVALQNGGNTVVGCDFQGGNSTAGPQRIGTKQGQFLIFISSNSDTVEGNTFENTWGNSAVQVNSDYTGILPANFMIQYNTFSHNAYYGPEVDLATSGAIENNLQTDGAMGPENDGCNNVRRTGYHYTRRRLQATV
jgi:hypothetical protein